MTVKNLPRAHKVLTITMECHSMDIDCGRGYSNCEKKKDIKAKNNCVKDDKMNWPLGRKWSLQIKFI